MITTKDNINMQVKSMLAIGIKQKVINELFKKNDGERLFESLLDYEIEYFKQVTQNEIIKMGDTVTTDQDVEVLNAFITPEMEKNAEAGWSNFAKKKDLLSNTEKSLVSIINMQEMRAKIKDSKLKSIIMDSDVKGRLIKYSELLKMQYGF